MAQTATRSYSLSNPVIKKAAFGAGGQPSAGVETKGLRNRIIQAAPATCSGSLGDPVINVDFGAGSIPGGPLAPGITTLQYATNCPDDGYYTITNNSGNCHDTWHTVTQDHTGNANGYFMLVNASNDPSVFFTQQAPVLCDNTTYEFSAYVLNLITLAASNSTVHHPDIQFSVETTDGSVLATFDTGTILPTASPEWVKESLFFTTPAGSAQVIVKMINKAPGGNGNDLLLDDITFRACGPVIQTGFTTVTANSPQNQCVGETKTYTLKSQIGTGYTNPQIQWQQNKNDGNGWIDITGETADSYTFTIAAGTLGTYQYRLAAAEGSNISSAHCRVFSDPLTVNVSAYPVVPAIPPQESCLGDVVTLTASGGATYEWSGPGITAGNKNQNPIIFDAVTTADQGSYSVVVTSTAGCSTTALTTLNVHLKPVATVDEPVHTICAGNSEIISVSAPDATNFSWVPTTGLSDPSVSNPIANPTVNTVYTVTATNDYGCTDVKTVTVNVLPLPVANAGANKKIFEGQSVTLNGSVQNGDVFYWTPTDYLSDPQSLTPVANPVSDITYTLHLTSTFNCGSTESSVFVRVYKKIVIPNTFSPNGDGRNDFWDIEALVTYPQCLLTVYNRNGQQVFKSIGYDHPWQGTYNGSPLPSGTYYYVLDLKSGAPLLSGWVVIVR
ncbi:gliding motility-associated C-terminal domain-containing protein [Mucilaginibacter sp. SP1R1]|uniref:gliding motility-associated C-terminal domain-containing protein n=1 Tax=Mucilaginibacter sp. SP1R1 TaxID=2723091 RepID=UPI001621DD4B|nr:gliding motility-associated C-terminal domain-containing protein [Mucilaginibacter sp. SP1R1]MBB6150870.1 gliding motility-associated-like protein [Mucilaginibacter sp. SP1R1]